MSLPKLYAFPTSQEDWRGWFFNHAANHYDWVNAPLAAGQMLVQYPLDKSDFSDMGMWFYQHQIMHNQANALLKTTGFDLSVLDWEDPDQLRNWLNLNGNEHVRISAALGVQ